VEAVLRAIAAQPGVASAGMISSAPFNSQQRYYGDTIRRAESPDSRSDVGTGFDGVAGDLFPTLGAPLLRGRFLSEADSAEGAPKTMVINQALARRLFNDEDPIGHHVHFKDADWQVVGLVRNMAQAQLDAPPPPMAYLPVLHFPWTVNIAVRTHGSPLAAVDGIRHAVSSVDPDQPIANLVTLQQAIDTSFTLQLRRTMLILVGAFAGIALLLACVGLYGVMSYSVTQRTREIGVRIALGADSASVLRHVVRGGLLLVLCGILLGSLGSVVAGFAVASQLFGTQLLDTGIVFALVAIALLGVAAFACWVPARRATRVDPMIALRAE
jgi:putative ABC transport system permease protein